MLHRNCGGEIKEDYSLPPYYNPNNPDEDVEGNLIYAIPAIVCMKCGIEILGDASIELGDENL